MKDVKQYSVKWTTLGE